MFTRTSPATRRRDTARRCTGTMPETVPRSVRAPVRRAGRRRGANGSRRPDALGGPECGRHPSPKARAMPVLVACVTLLAMLYVYSGWHR
jgi:hypothetical protein